MIGDSSVDLAAAHAAGTRAVYADWGFNSVDMLAAPASYPVADTPGRTVQVLGLGSKATASTASISEAKLNSI